VGGSEQLHHSQLGNRDVLLLCEALKKYPGELCRLHLPNNPLIGDEAAAAIASLLKVNAQIKVVDLRLDSPGGVLSGVGVGAITEAVLLNQDTALAALLLSNNSNVGDAGANAIANLLSVNRVITDVLLDGVQLSDLGISKLVQSLKQNTVVQVLELGSTDSVKESWVDTVDWLLVNRDARDVRNCNGVGVLLTTGLASECACYGTMLGVGRACATHCNGLGTLQDQETACTCDVGYTAASDCSVAGSSTITATTIISTIALLVAAQHLFEFNGRCRGHCILQQLCKCGTL
jgi:hypothetical protein